jgi:tetratricopeptide (TPR) repeat protein
MSTNRRRAGLPTLVAVLAAAACVSGGAHGLDDTADPPRQYVINGQIISGWIIEEYEDHFLFRDAATNLDIELLWEALDPIERRRVRGGRPEGAPGGASPAQTVKLIGATRYYLKDGREITGLERTELSSEQHIVIRKKSVPRFRIPRKLVENREPVQVPITVIYSLDELYLIMQAERNPKTGKEHYDLALDLMGVGDYGHAIDHFRRAELLDTRLQEAAARKIAEAEAARLEETLRYLDAMIAKDKRAGRYAKALERIEELETLDPNHPVSVTWVAKKPEIMDSIRKSLRSSVVSSYYQKMEELVREYAFGRVVEGAEIPGKVVTVRGGEAYKGRFVEENDEFVVLDDGGRRIEIARSLVTSVDSVNLNPNRRSPTFAESKKYIQDAAGLTADVLRELEGTYGELIRSQAEDPANVDVQEEITGYWDDRLRDVVTITAEGKRRTMPVYTWHQASYSKGSWLREGGAGAAVVTAGEGRRQSSRRGSSSALEADPEKWWEQQPHELRYQILRAVAAEALCDVQDIIRYACPACSGKGGIQQISVGVREGRPVTGYKVCATCRGSGKLVKIRYR